MDSVRPRAPWAPPPDPASLDSPTCEPGLMAGTQLFRFREEPVPGGNRAVLEVRVPQVLHVQYGMYVWPCAVVLAQYLWFHRRSLPGKAVLEVGAGVSLPGILAAKCGAKVILSDSSEFPHCLDICRQSCQMNNLPQVEVVGLTWGHISKDILSLPPQDIILGSDVFFEPEDFESILATVYFLMQKNPKVQFWSTYQVRSADWSLEGLLYKWDMKCVHIPLESFDADKEDIAESTLPGRHTVEMLIISFAKDSF
ncbi:histone-arginine methyltransferase METTL23 [Mus musculus]|uniref:Histone-arginine methyltransferase METTL23 n=2 Tax=Mus musculus TaxID=10090 RepID=MET23_MOUSE|nr:histone-arginine methyltransferase METTL23 [Mus musculus]A2AA28.1 RecName: Full=Histone-arginine methyltransferase METTL23; AltName: Full=Methyltransferase-like protein 23 [Mus musculus]|eukprot:NP_083141.3 methyltransferase-like protein 23 [Mus musculus]